MFIDLPESESDAHTNEIREKIKKLTERAEAFTRILPNLTDSEEKHKLEQLIEHYRLDAERLSERIRAVDSD